MPTAPYTKSGSTIVSDFAAAAQSASQSPLDFAIGAVLRAIAEATAAVADWLQKLYLFALLVSRLQTSQGTWVDTFCVDFMPAVAGSVTAALPNGSPRLQATSATGTVTFSRATPQAQAIIPVGTEVATFDNTQVFTVYADSTNSAYSATIIPGGAYIVAANVSSLDIPVFALSPGSAANVLAGTITLIRSSLIGIDSVTNAAPFANGLDQETDDQLKTRFKLFIQSLRAGTVPAIQYEISSLQQGMQSVVHENMLPDGMTDDGSITVYVDDGSGSPSSTLVQACARAVDSVRAAGIRPNVIGASTLGATVTMTITTAAGYYHPTIVAAVSNAVAAYINALGLETTLRFTELEHVAYSASTAVTNVSAVTLNNGTSDLVPAMGQTIKVINPGVVVS